MLNLCKLDLRLFWLAFLFMYSEQHPVLQVLKVYKYYQTFHIKQFSNVIVENILLFIFNKLKRSNLRKVQFLEKGTISP